MRGSHLFLFKCVVDYFGEIKVYVFMFLAGKKRDIFKRIIYELDKPFVLLMNMMAVNYQEISEIFANYVQR